MADDHCNRLPHSRPDRVLDLHLTAQRSNRQLDRRANPVGGRARTMGVFAPGGSRFPGHGNERSHHCRAGTRTPARLKIAGSPQIRSPTDALRRSGIEQRSYVAGRSYMCILIPAPASRLPYGLVGPTSACDGVRNGGQHQSRTICRVHRSRARTRSSQGCSRSCRSSDSHGNSRRAAYSGDATNQVGSAPYRRRSRPPWLPARLALQEDQWFRRAEKEAPPKSSWPHLQDSEGVFAWLPSLVLNDVSRPLWRIKPICPVLVPRGAAGCAQKYSRFLRLCRAQLLRASQLSRVHFCRCTSAGCPLNTAPKELSCPPMIAASEAPWPPFADGDISRESPSCTCEACCKRSHSRRQLP